MGKQVSHVSEFCIFPTKYTCREELSLRGFLQCPRCGKPFRGRISKKNGENIFTITVYCNVVNASVIISAVPCISCCRTSKLKNESIGKSGADEGVLIVIKYICCG
jgi:hypothetical protein